MFQKKLCYFCKHLGVIPMMNQSTQTVFLEEASKFIYNSDFYTTTDVYSNFGEGLDN